MSRHTEESLRRLADRLETQCGRVVRLLDRSGDLLLSDLREDAESAVSLDEAIDAEEVALEEDCLGVIALHHPVGTELRVLATLLKANNDLERIADHAVNVARRAARLPPSGKMPQQVGLLFRSVRDAFVLSVRALLDRDEHKAYAVLAGDKLVDALEDAVVAAAMEHAQNHPEEVAASFLLARVAHDLERIADLAKNLAEDVLYLRTGEIVRHRGQG